MRWTATVIAFAIASMQPLMAGAQDAPGKAAYDKNCASCHGPDGAGVPKKAAVLKIDPATLNLGRDEVAKQTKEEKKEITLKGKNKMPGYEKKLAPADVDPVMDYTMSLIAKLRAGK
jgi:mono/diheme cytochrome c family protein